MELNSENLNENSEKYSFSNLGVKSKNCYYILDKQKKRFNPKKPLKSKTIKDVFDFAYRMTFGGEGEHRDHRSGGSYTRKCGEIFANAFQGKIAECAACNYFRKYDETSEPDFTVNKLGVWDNCDLKVGSKEIAVKSTKSFGNLLLLETKDWDNEGNYIPNSANKNSKYDFIVMIRIKPSCEDLMKKYKILYSDLVDREYLYNIISKESWEYDCPGYITHDELKYIINKGFIIEKGCKLNDKTTMDADNYYIQSGDLHDINSINKEFE